MNKRHLVLLAAGAALLTVGALSGCGPKDETTNAPATGTTSTTAASPGAPAPASSGGMAGNAPAPASSGGMGGGMSSPGAGGMSSPGAGGMASPGTMSTPGAPPGPR